MADKWYGMAEHPPQAETLIVWRSGRVDPGAITAARPKTGEWRPLTPDELVTSPAPPEPMPEIRPCPNPNCPRDGFVGPAEDYDRRKQIYCGSCHLLGPAAATERGAIELYNCIRWEAGNE